MKFNYRIKNSITGKFITLKRKSTWMQPKAVIDAAKRIANKSLSAREYRDSVSLEDLEIVIIPIEKMQTMKVKEFIEVLDMFKNESKKGNN